VICISEKHDDASYSQSGFVRHGYKALESGARVAPWFTAARPYAVDCPAGPTHGRTLSANTEVACLSMAIANGHQGQEQLVDEKEKTHGLVEIVEPNDRAYFKAQLLDINIESREYFVRYEDIRLTHCMSFILFLLVHWLKKRQTVCNVHS
jgi:hypothetical protein